MSTLLEELNLSPLPAIQVAPQRWIGDDQPCFIVAEVGQNHNGEMKIARELIDNIAFFKADAVKLYRLAGEVAKALKR